MKKIILSLLLVAGTPALASANVNIFACEPEWGALAREIGGDKVEVKDATTAQQDPHHIQAKPSLMAAIRKADMVFCTGSELEIGWLPVILTQAGNSKVQPGNDGSLMAADFVHKLEVPTRLDRADGDVHPGGNPHIQTDPHNIALVAGVFAKKIEALDPVNAAYYQARYTDFSGRWNAAIKKWEADAAGLRGTPIAVQHSAWAYLVHWLGLNIVVPLEPKPGVPPTSSYLAEVLEKVKTHPVKMVIYAPFEDGAPSKWLAEKDNIPAVQLPFTVGGNEQSKDLFGMFDSTIALLKGAANAK